MAHESPGRVGWASIYETSADKSLYLQTLWTPPCISIAPISEAGPAGSQDNQNISDVILIPSKLHNETTEKQRFFQKAALTAKPWNNSGNLLRCT